MRYNLYHKHDHTGNFIATADASASAEDYIKKAVEYGHTTYFTTNHGILGDIFEAKELCDKYGIHCKAGLEGYIVPYEGLYKKDKSNYHIVIIPRTNEARKKLNVISSNAHKTGFYFKPRLNIKELLELDKDDVYITTACLAGIIRDETGIEKIFKPLMEHFGENLYLEVQSHNVESQKDLNRKCLKMAEKYNLKLIAATDSHYVDEVGKMKRTEMMKDKKMTYGDEDTFMLDYPDRDTLVKRFKEQGVLTDTQIEEAIDNTLIFDDIEDIYLDKEIKMPTIYPDLSTEERVDLLKQIVNERFKEVKKKEHLEGEKLQKYIDAIHYEMDIIEKTNPVCHTADYFLFNTKMVDLAVNKYDGVLTRTGRGSAGAFYINNLLGMTQLDRLDIDIPLYPDRFMSTARLIENRALPDIDFNVKEQEPFIKASRELLGAKMCYPMILFGTMGSKASFKSLCRARGIPYEEADKVSKNMAKYKDKEEWKNLIEDTKNFMGTIMTAAVHPCACVLSNEDLEREYGVVRAGKALCVMITSAEADAFKVLKNDYLIVTIWKQISDAFDFIGRPILPLKQLLEETKNDKRVWDLYKKGVTCTLNQVDTDNGTWQAMKYKVSSFEEGAFLSAAIRPAFDSWRTDFLNRKDNDTGSETLNQILKSTHGYILFQENLMQVFEFMDVTPAESIGLIKKISKKKIKQEDFDNLEERMRKAWTRKTGSEEGFDHTWQLMQSCMSYGFASPHACACSADALYSAWLKVHYPLEYMTVALTNYAKDKVRTPKLTEELTYFGITLNPPKFRYSKAGYEIDKETNSIYKGIESIKELNANMGEELYALRNEKFESFFDLLEAIREKTKLNKKHLTILIKSDFFSEFGNPNELLYQMQLHKALANVKKLTPKQLASKHLSIPARILEKASTPPEKGKVTYANVDWKHLCSLIVKEPVALLSDSEDHPMKRETSIMEKIAYSTECLGFCSIKDESVPKNVYYVLDIDGKNKKKYLTLHSIHTGRTGTVCSWENDVCTLEKGTLIQVRRFIKEYKALPTGKTKPNGKPEWKKSPENGTERWLKEWVYY